MLLPCCCCCCCCWWQWRWRWPRLAWRHLYASHPSRQWAIVARRRRRLAAWSARLIIDVVSTTTSHCCSICQRRQTRHHFARQLATASNHIHSYTFASPSRLNERLCQSAWQHTEVHVVTPDGCFTNIEISFMSLSYLNLHNRKSPWTVPQFVFVKFRM